MRLTNYKVMRKDGTIFTTTHWTEATENGNKIIETFLTAVDEKTDEQKQQIKERREKRQKFWKEKREKGI